MFVHSSTIGADLRMPLNEPMPGFKDVLLRQGHVHVLLFAPDQDTEELPPILGPDERRVGRGTGGLQVPRGQ